jgi:hypothetical protein
MLIAVVTVLEGQRHVHIGCVAAEKMIRKTQAPGLDDVGYMFGLLAVTIGL